MRTVSNLMHLLPNFTETVPNALQVIGNISQFMVSSEDITPSKRMMNVQMIASGVKRIGVSKVSLEIHHWIA